jgi:hypothetical protein
MGDLSRERRCKAGSLAASSTRFIFSVRIGAGGEPWADSALQPPRSGFASGAICEVQAADVTGPQFRELARPVQRSPRAAGIGRKLARRCSVISSVLPAISMVIFRLARGAGSALGRLVSRLAVHLQVYGTRARQMCRVPRPIWRERAEKGVSRSAQKACCSTGSCISVRERFAEKRAVRVHHQMRSQVLTASLFSLSR